MRAERTGGSVRGRALALFFLANFAAACAVAYRYVLAGPPLGSLRGAVFAHLALGSQVGVLLLLVLAAAALPALWRRTAFLVRPLAAAGATLLLAALFVDATIYALYRFHVNALVLKVLGSPGEFRTMQLPTAQLALTLAATGGVLALQWWGLGRLERLLARRPALLPRPRRTWALLVAAVVTAGLAERALYVAASLRHDPQIPRLARLVPLYQPVTIPGLAGGDRAAARREEPGAPPRGLLAYPRAPLAARVGPDAPSVLWIVLDGWRADLLDPETTPEIWAFSRRAQVFRRHTSGGNATRTGIFSMFYGLHGTYWQPVLAERRGPVLLAKLREAGYRVHAIAAAPLDHPEFRDTVFAEVPDAEIEDRMPGELWWQKDEAAAGRLDAFLGGLGEGERFFAFLFLDATHNPFDSPPSHRRFQPAAASIDWLAIRARRGIPELRNRYRNAIAWDDALVGRALRSLRRRGLRRDTVVVITSDHGHEFYEHGYFGYNGAFTPEEIDVPLVLAAPGIAPAEHDYPTEHQDLPGTILRLLGVDDDPAGYTLGRDLFDPAPRPFALACSYTECALRDADGWLVFGTEGHTLLRFEARDRDYAELDDPGPAVRRRAGEITTALEEMRRFLR